LLVRVPTAANSLTLLAETILGISTKIRQYKEPHNQNAARVLLSMMVAVMV